jgi:DNA polymerase III delta prime subunit
MAGGRKVVIIDEADYLTPNAQAILRNAIEEYSSNCSFIFTCNYKNKIIEPLHSRCAVVEFVLKNGERAKMAGAFFKRIQNILGEKEHIEYEDKVIVEIIKKHFPDFRRVLNELQRYSKFGKIDTGLLAQIQDVSISEIIKFMKEKDFTSIRKWVGSNDIDPTTFFRKIYDSLYDSIKPQSIPRAVLILADYQYKNAFVADTEINVVACLIEIMADCEFV